MPRTTVACMMLSLIAVCACTDVKSDGFEAYRTPDLKGHEGDDSGAALDLTTQKIAEDSAQRPLRDVGILRPESLPLFSDPVLGETALQGGRGIELGISDDAHEHAADGGLGEAFKRTPGASYAACEAVRSTRAFFADLSVADDRLCVFKSALASLGEKALDGKTHAVRIPASGNDNDPDHARFRVIKAGSAGAFADVALALCKGGKQVAYARYEMSENHLLLEAKAMRGNGSQLLTRLTANSRITANGRLTGAKKVTSQRRGAVAEATMTARELVLSRSEDLRLFADMELFDANIAGSRYGLASLAIGDGVALIADGAARVRQSWSGDTWEISDDTPFAARAADADDEDLLTVSEELVTFDRDEAYECDAAEDLTVEAEDVDFGSCTDLTLPRGTVDCRAVTTSTAAK